MRLLSFQQPNKSVKNSLSDRQAKPSKAEARQRQGRAKAEPRQTSLVASDGALLLAKLHNLSLNIQSLALPRVVHVLACKVGGIRLSKKRKKEEGRRKKEEGRGRGRKETKYKV